MTSDPAAVLRTLLESTSDDAIHALIETFVRGILQGIVDELGDRIIDHLVDQLAIEESAQPAPPPAPVPAPDPDPTATPAQDADRLTCSICGRVGTRRYTLDGNGGWRCSPTATACPGNKAAAATPPVPDPPPPPPPPAPEPEPEPDIPLNGSTMASEAEFPTAPPATPKPAGTPTVTARCNDCPRAWNLTGRVLVQAVDMHELKHSHIVHIEDGADT